MYTPTLWWDGMYIILTISIPLLGLLSTNSFHAARVTTAAQWMIIKITKTLRTWWSWNNTSRFGNLSLEAYCTFCHLWDQTSYLNLSCMNTNSTSGKIKRVPNILMIPSLTYCMLWDQMSSKMTWIHFFWITLNMGNLSVWERAALDTGSLWPLPHPEAPPTTALLITVVPAVVGAIAHGPLRDAAVVSFAAELRVVVTVISSAHLKRKKARNEVGRTRPAGNSTRRLLAAVPQRTGSVSSYHVTAKQTLATGISVRCSLFNTRGTTESWLLLLSQYHSLVLWCSLEWKGEVGVWMKRASTGP